MGELHGWSCYSLPDSTYLLCISRTERLGNTLAASSPCSAPFSFIGLENAAPTEFGGGRVCPQGYTLLLPPHPFLSPETFHR